MLSTRTRSTPRTHARPTQTAIFAAIPQELQDTILSYVGAKDLHNLSLTCLTLRATTLPFLYSRITLTWNITNTWLPPALREPRSELLLQTLAISPDLASLIRALNFRFVNILSDAPQTLLAVAPNITSLTLDFYLYHNTSRSDHINGSSLTSLLNPVKQTLATLKISYGMDLDDMTDWPESCTQGHCSLANFPALKTLVIPLSVLLGWDPVHAPRLSSVLPRSLLLLVLREYEQFDNFLLWSEGHMDRAIGGFEEIVREGFGSEVKVERQVRWLKRS